MLWQTGPTFSLIGLQSILISSDLNFKLYLTTTYDSPKSGRDCQICRNRITASVSESWATFWYASRILGVSWRSRHRVKGVRCNYILLRSAQKLAQLCKVVVLLSRERIKVTSVGNLAHCKNVMYSIQDQQMTDGCVLPPENETFIWNIYYIYSFFSTSSAPVWFCTSYCSEATPDCSYWCFHRWLVHCHGNRSWSFA